MKVVAVALVLIAGAAVVLWYGNTANSWVVGGLVGGLAALLLSIPISLSLFSYLSRRHDERLRAEEALVEEEVSLSQVDDESRFIGRAGRRPPQYVESSIYELQEEFEIEDDERYEEERARRRPSPSQKRWPVGGHSSEHRPFPLNTHGASFARELPELPAPKPRTKELNEQTKDPDRTLPRRGQYPGLPGSDRSKYQSQALRTARLEAAGQRDEEGPRSTQNLRKYPAGGTKSLHPRRKLSGQISQSVRRSEDRSAAEDFAVEEEQSSRQRRHRGMETGPITRHVTETEPILPQSEQLYPGTRHPHIEQGYLKAEEDINNAHRTKPLIRRAPYLYEDDPLRQELYQHIETPQVRRSSRKETMRHGEEEE